MKVTVEYFNRRPSKKDAPLKIYRGGSGYLSKDYEFTAENGFKCEMDASDAGRFCQDNGASFRIVSALSIASLSDKGEEDDIFQAKNAIDADESETMAGEEGPDPNAPEPESKEVLVGKLMTGLNDLNESQIREYVKSDELFRGLVLASNLKRETILKKIETFLTNKTW